MNTACETNGMVMACRSIIMQMVVIFSIIIILFMKIAGTRASLQEEVPVTLHGLGYTVMGRRNAKYETDMTNNATLNLKMESFLGIPYAMPPIGDLRWQPPQHLDTWNASDRFDDANSILDASVYDACCMQGFIFWSLRSVTWSGDNVCDN